MSRIATHPAFLLALGLVTGPLAGLGWYGSAASRLVRAAAVRPPDPVVEEQRSQGWDFWTIEIDGLAAELKEERARQRQQSEQLELRAGRLASEQQELERLRTELEAMRAAIEGKVRVIQADELKSLRTLAQTYANLTPRGAVAIVREMDDATVVKILALMKADTVGAIFEEMSRTSGTDGPLAVRAAHLSEQLRLTKVAPVPEPAAP